MRCRSWVGVAVGMVALATLAAAPRARADVSPGDARTVQVREGSVVREKPRIIAKKIATLEYGTRVTVDEVESFWAKIATEAGVKGWVRAAELVEPNALTGPGAYGPTAPANVTSADITAAGRQFRSGQQFDAKTEKTFAHMNPEVGAAYPMVDRVEADRPTDDQLHVFASEGMLAGTNLPDGGGKFARLRLQAVIGDGAIEVSSAVPDAPLTPTPQSDLEFVERLGQALSPEQEYWLGRSVAASAIAKYKLDPDPKRQAMVKRIGGTIVRMSERLRATYGGYHFAVLDDPNPNGVSGPGGFVFVTRGAIALARNEDEVAGILAHEIAHVALKHGEAVMRRTKEFQAQYEEMRDKAIRPRPGPDGCNICADVAKLLGEGSARLVESLDVEGYGREFEMQADWDGSLYLCEVGYRSGAIAEYLEVVPEREKVRWTTHPSSEERIEALRPIVYRHTCPFDSDGGAQARLPRFRALSGIVVPPPAPPVPDVAPPPSIPPSAPKSGPKPAVPAGSSTPK